MLLGGVGGATRIRNGNVLGVSPPPYAGRRHATENGYVPPRRWSNSAADGKYLQGWVVHPRTQISMDQSRPAACGVCRMPKLHGEHRTNGDWRPGTGEHGIAIDAARQCLADRQWRWRRAGAEFTNDGTFLLQIGKSGVSVDSNDTSM